MSRNDLESPSETDDNFKAVDPLGHFDDELIAPCSKENKPLCD